MRPARRLLTALACSASLLASVGAQQASADVPRRGEQRVESGRVVVRFQPGTPAAARQRAVAASRSRRLTRVGALNLEVVETSDVHRTIARLRARGDVRWAQREAVAQRLELSAASTPERTELRVTQAVTAAGSGFLGSGVKVGVIDDGVWRTADLGFSGDSTSSTTNRLRDGGNCSDGDCDVCVPMPDHPCHEVGANTAINTGSFSAGAHGTAVATLIGARDNAVGIIGTAPLATIYSYRVFPSAVEGASDAAIAAALVEAADDGMDVVNLSLGTPIDSQTLRDAMTYVRATAPNLVVVAAAGNDSSERASYPAGNPGVLSVGASECVLTSSSPTSSCNSADRWRVAAFSTGGDVDVIAPGVKVRAWYAGGESAPVNPESQQCSSPSAVTCINGTSFAAPLVAGVVAGLAGKGIRGDRARAAIAASSRRVTDTAGRPRAASGYGRVDAALAYATATSSQAYSAAFFERGAFVPRAVGHRRVELLRVDPTATGINGPATLLVDPGDGRASKISDEAPTAGTPTVHRSLWTYRAPRSHAGTGLDLLVGAPGETRKPVSVSLLDPTGGPEGKPVGAGLAETTTRLTYGTSSSVLYEIALEAGDQLKLTYAYPELSETSLVEVWAPDSVTGGQGASDYSYRYDGDPLDTSPFDGEFIITAPAAGRVTFGVQIFAPVDDGDYTIAATVLP